MDPEFNLELFEWGCLEVLKWIDGWVSQAVEVNEIAQELHES